MTAHHFAAQGLRSFDLNDHIPAGFDDVYYAGVRFGEGHVRSTFVVTNLHDKNGNDRIVVKAGFINDDGDKQRDKFILHTDQAANDDYAAYAKLQTDYTGTAFNDFLKGNKLGNEISGLGGDDRLLGKGGTDYIDAGTGNDLVNLGRGNGYANGGQGHDIFIFRGNQFDYYGHVTIISVGLGPDGEKQNDKISISSDWKGMMAIWDANDFTEILINGKHHSMSDLVAAGRIEVIGGDWFISNNLSSAEKDQWMDDYEAFKPEVYDHLDGPARAAHADQFEFVPAANDNQPQADLDYGLAA